jgi:hypothetical protein
MIRSHINMIMMIISHNMMRISRYYGADVNMHRKAIYSDLWSSKLTVGRNGTRLDGGARAVGASGTVQSMYRLPFGAHSREDMTTAITSRRESMDKEQRLAASGSFFYQNADDRVQDKDMLADEYFVRKLK